MSATRRHRSGSLLDDYCSQLGTLLERRYTERALIAAKEQAEKAAALAERAMRQAQAADRAKSHFLATMTHELRTPLNAIIGFSEILLAVPRQSGEAPTYAQYIHESGTQLLGMLNGVLDLARIEAGKLELDEQEVMLEEVVEAAIRPLRAMAEDKQVAIVCGAMIGSPLWLDPAKMTQVFVNLLSNAVKFTPSGGSINIESALAAGEFSISVCDTGVGIPANDVERVLQPFGQIEDHLTRQNGGLGLGLPIARALVRMHGGDLTLKSEIGAGTTVEVRLPANRLRRHTAAQVVRAELSA